MKQPKKPTRRQREYLQRKKKIDTDGILVVEDTNTYIKILRGTEIETINK